jgi:hypothetical protein
MPHRFAYLLLMLCVSAIAVQAQENTQPLPPPQASPSASGCSNAPDPNTDSREYNSGFKDGYKEGCKDARSNQHSTSSIHLDDAVGDLPSPDTALLFDVNNNLLKLLGDVCKGADTDALKKGRSQSDAERVKYRMALLRQLIEKPPRDCK